jgi:hypothetical protein
MKVFATTEKTWICMKKKTFIKQKWVVNLNGLINKLGQNEHGVGRMVFCIELLQLDCCLGLHLFSSRIFVPKIGEPIQQVNWLF